VEVVALVGDVARERGRPKIHAHAVLGRRDGSTCGGHLLEGHVRPTLEVMLVQSPAHLARTVDTESALALIDIGK
jgi:predicted DNA-binding protein with PD1-like motif